MNIDYLEILNKIEQVDEDAFLAAQRRIDRLAKPPGSLGGLEEIAARLCGISGNANPDIGKKCIIVMAADHGVVEEGVSSAPQSVTASQTINMLKGITGVGVLARHYGVDLMVTDVGVSGDIHHPKLINRKIRYATGNIAKEPAMSRKEAVKAVETGIELACIAKEKGYRMIGTGEMGIGNTTASSAVIAALLGIPSDDVEGVTGTGGGLTKEAYQKKIKVIQEAMVLHRPEREDPVDILAKVGGLDIAGLTGVFIGAAFCRLPVIVDGLISAAAALCADRLNEKIRGYLFASHRSFEKGYVKVQEYLGLKPCLYLDMRLGEGSGCPLMMGVMEAALALYKEMATFEEASIDDGYLDQVRAQMPGREGSR